MAARHPFTRRIGYHWTCVMLADALTNDPLVDNDGTEEAQTRFEPATGKATASLRSLASTEGLCYLAVVKTIAPGLYWAHVASTPDLSQAYPVILTEEHLTYALPWDCRLANKRPKQIRRILRMHGNELQPARRVKQEAPTDTERSIASEPAVEVAKPADLTPPPSVPLVPMKEEIVVSTDAFQEAAGGTRLNREHLGAVPVQQALLSAAIDTLMSQLYAGCDMTRALVLKAQCQLIVSVQRWQQRTRQRVVNASPAWSEQLRRSVWRLSIGIPDAAYMAVAA
jgi:hypothetical protein